jgi:hypothetical protein
VSPATDAVAGRAGDWETLQTEILQMFLKPGDVVLDVGAHIGSHAVAFARVVHPGGAVHAFEPQKGEGWGGTAFLCTHSTQVFCAPMAPECHGCTFLPVLDPKVGPHRCCCTHSACLVQVHVHVSLLRQAWRMCCKPTPTCLGWA